MGSAEVRVEVRGVAGAALDEARALLTRLEAASGLPPVDEDEQRRLAGAPSVRDRDWDWGGHLVMLDDVPVAYTGVRIPPADVGAGTCAGRVDIALDRSHPQAQLALAAALSDVRDHADRRGTSGRGPVEAWLRGATAEDLATAAGVGFSEKGRMHVLGADVGTIVDGEAAAGPAAPGVPDGLRLRAFDPVAPSDSDAVVTLLSRAYPELGDGYVRGFARLRDSDWFRAEDLLLLEDAADGRLLGLHWMKRRGDGVGEVYNLAVDPDAQGRGYGPLLLDIGLAHLAAVGSREVVLWVHATNTRAFGLYRSRGFEPRWEDVSLVG